MGLRRVGHDWATELNWTVRCGAWASPGGGSSWCRAWARGLRASVVAVWELSSCGVQALVAPWHAESSWTILFGLGRRTHVLNFFLLFKALCRVKLLFCCYFYDICYLNCNSVRHLRTFRTGRGFRAQNSCNYRVLPPYQDPNKYMCIFFSFSTVYRLGLIMLTLWWG